jgi:putative ABC transport system permease protein
MLFVILRSAFASLMRNRMRTLLTTLGISIGIAAVICTVALGAGSAAEVERQLDNLGEDFIWIEPGSFNSSGVRTGWGGARTLTVEDAVVLPRQIPEVAMCSPQIEDRAQIIIGNQNWNTRYRGVSPEFFAIRRWNLLRGTFFTDYDVQNYTKVLVLGEEVATRLFGDENPVGQTVRMGRFPFLVLGVLESKGTSSGGVDRDDAAFLPYTTSTRTLDAQDWVDDVMCSATSPALLERAEFQIMQLLRIRHGIEEGEDDDFGIRKPETVIELRAESSRTMAMMLVAIASVSLLVGGVGIMNIMLVSVTERTREIGLRKSLGARRRDILLQFLIESLVLCLVGGALGLGAGAGGSLLLRRMAGWNVAVAPEAVLLAFGFSAAVGIFFGLWPARRAAALEPIEALRWE